MYICVWCGDDVQDNAPHRDCDEHFTQYYTELEEAGSLSELDLEDDLMPEEVWP